MTFSGRESGARGGLEARAREPGAEAAALAGLARDRELPAVARERVLHDRETQARAAGLAGAAAVDAIEAFREPRDVLGRDADAGVLDLERGAVLGALPFQPHLPLLG